MSRTRLSLIAAAMLALFILAGCGGSAPAVPTLAATPTPPPPGLPTSQPTVPAEGADPDAPPALDYAGSGVEPFESYSTSLAVEFSGASADGSAASLTLNSQHRRRDGTESGQLADYLRMQYSASGAAALIGQGVVILTQLGGAEGVQGYFEAQPEGQPRTCAMLTDPALDAAEASFLSLETLIQAGSVTGMQRVEPNELVGGIESRHYRAENVTFGEFTSATVDLWVAREGGYVTRLEISGEGAFEGFGAGTMQAVYLLESANEPVAILAPEGCSAG